MRILTVGFLFGALQAFGGPVPLTGSGTFSYNGSRGNYSFSASGTNGTDTVRLTVSSGDNTASFLVEAITPETLGFGIADGAGDGPYFNALGGGTIDGDSSTMCAFHDKFSYSIGGGGGI